MKIMKKTIYILVIIGLFFGACDKIDEPYLEPGSGSGPDPSDKPRKVLLEEFTGHTCVNCPEAAILAQQTLKVIFGEQLILVTVHAGAFALPGIAPYETDFRTPTGNDLENEYVPQLFPSGLVNRVKYEGNTVLLKDSWQPAIQELLDTPAEAAIEIEHNYNAGTRKLDLHIISEFLADLSGTYNLSVFITESGIIAAQKNNNPDIGPSPDWEDYEHNHVLRTSVSGTWGEQIAVQPASGDAFEKDLSIILDNDWDENEIGVVAIIIDASTYEVIQAEEIHID